MAANRFLTFLRANVLESTPCSSVV